MYCEACGDIQVDVCRRGAIEESGITFESTQSL